MDRQPWIRLWNFIKHHRSELYTIYFFAVIGGLLQLSLPIGIQAVVSLSIGAAWATSIYVLIFFVVLGILLVGIIQLNQMRLIERMQQTIFTDNAVSYSRKIPELDLLSFNNYYLPEQVNRFFESFQIQKTISKVLLDIPTATIQILFGLILLGFYHPTFIIFGISLTLIVVMIIRLTINPGLRSSLEESNMKYVNTAWIVEMARVAMSLKIARRNFLGMRKMDGYIIQYLNKRNKHFSILLLQYKSLVGFKVLITAAMLSIGAFLLIDQKITIGEFIAAEIVILTVVNSVEKLIAAMDNIYDIVTGLEKMESILDAPAENNGSLRFLPSGSGPDIEFIDFGFTYPNGSAVFRDLNTRIPGNSIYILKGKLGYGKSTLLKILSTQYRNYSGSILLNGVSMNAFDQDTIRSNTGLFISQRELFQGSLRENIGLGNEAVTDNDILAMMARIGFGELINEFQNALDTLIDPAGNRLASNKVNKILLLRALVHKPSLILLDEPLLHLGHEEKKRVLKYIEEISAHSTVIIASEDESLEGRNYKTFDLK